VQQHNLIRALFELDGIDIPDYIEGLGQEDRRHLYHIAVQQVIMEVLVSAGVTTPQGLSMQIESKLMAIATDPELLEEALASTLIMPYEEDNNGEETSSRK